MSITDPEKIERPFSPFQKMLNFLIKFLSGRKTGIIILLFVVFIKIIQICYLYYLRPDMSFQFIFAHSFIHHSGITEPLAFANDISQIHHSNQFKWPPGFAILFAPFYFVFGENHYLAALVFNSLFSVLLIIVNRKILRLFEVKEHLVNIFTLLTGLSIFYLESEPSTDAIAVPFLMIAVYLSFRIIKYKDNYLATFSGITAALVLTASIKYLYIPIVFLVPLFILFIAIQKKEKMLLRGSFISFISLLIILGSVLLWQKINSGSIAYIQQTTRGFFIANILEFHPFIPSSIIKKETLSMIFGEIAEKKIFLVFQFLHVLGLGLATYFMIRMSKQHSPPNRSYPKFFLQLSFLLVAGITFQLFILSISVKAENDIIGTWTYIEEPRYYGALTVMIHLALFVFFSYFHGKKNLMASRIFLFLILLLLPEASRGLVFAINRIKNYSREEYMWHMDEKNEQVIKGLIKEQLANSGNQKVIVTGSSNWSTWKAGLFSMQPVLKDYTRMNDLKSIKTSEPVLIFFILDTNHKKNFRPFLNKYSANYIDSFHRWRYYVIPVIPN